MDHDAPALSNTWPIRCPQCGDAFVVALPGDAAAGHIGAATCWYGHTIPYRFDGSKVVTVRKDPSPIRANKYVRIRCRACGETSIALAVQGPKSCAACASPIAGSTDRPQHPEFAAPTRRPVPSLPDFPKPQLASSSRLRRSRRLGVDPWLVDGPE